MTIDEAISLLKQYIDYNNPDIPDFYTMEEACKVVIEALENQPTDAVDRVTIKEYLDSFGKDTNDTLQTCENCISRQAALEAFGLSEKSRKYGGDHSGYDTLMKYEIQDILEDLPSVTPQPCEEREQGKCPFYAS